MKIFFRADASVGLGGGHLMRCLTLADELRAKGCEITFICCDLSGNLFSLLEEKVYPVWKLAAPEDGVPLKWREDAAGTARCIEASGGRADWVVVDHYELDARWESSLREHTKKIMVIDDLANRPHDCELLLDQNYYRDLDIRYDGLVPAACLKLLGPEYVLLRPEFRQAREHLRVRDGHVKRILISFGATDPENHTAKVLEAMTALNRNDIAADVVVGATNPHRESIKGLCSTLPNVNYHCQVTNMAVLMQQADIAIGAGGATTWERCTLGLPAITVVLAPNQLRTTVDLAAIGAIWFLGWADDLVVEDYVRAILKGIGSSSELTEISKKAMGLMRGVERKNSYTIVEKLLSTSELRYKSC